MGNQLETTEWLMLRPVISRKGELNEWVLIVLMIKIKGVIEINGVVKVWLNIITGVVAVNSARECPHDSHFGTKNYKHFITVTDIGWIMITVDNSNRNVWMSARSKIKRRRP